MEFLSKYSLPLAAALLLMVFFIALPELKHSILKEPERDRYKIKRADVLIMALISLCYGALAFYRLGNMNSPESFVDMRDKTAYVELELSEERVTRLMLYTGVGIGGYTIEYSTDGVDNYVLAEFRQSHAEDLKWHDVALDYYVSGGTVKISGYGNVFLGEVVPLTADGDIIPCRSEDAALCDEQQLCPEKQNFLNSSYFDEIYHARTAWEHLEGIYPYEITHPPLGKIIISLGISLFGMTPFGWRFSGTFFGLLMLPLIYIFSKKLFGGRAVPTAVTMLMATDFMHFVQTRIATIDTYAVFFILLMYLFMYLFVSGGRWRNLALSGIFFGMGAASKWTCFYAGAGLALIWLIYVIVKAERGELDFRGFAKLSGFCLIFFVLIPCGIYYLSYIPYGIAQGKTNIFSPDYLRIVLDNQSYMFNYHSGIVAEHPYASRWYQWMLDIRPILYYLEYLPDGRRSSFGAWVNPVLCWGGLVSLFFTGYLAVGRRDMRSGFILLGYLAQLLPWVPIARLTFAYHYFPCTVFLCLSMGQMFNVIRLNSKNWRLHIAAFVLGSLAVFVLFYPALSGAARGTTDILRWLPTWPF